MTGLHMPAAGSLRLRFLAAVLLWVMLGIGGVWYSAGRVFTRHIAAQYHEDLHGHVEELAQLVSVTPKDGLVLTRPLSDPRFSVPLSGYYWQVSVDQGAVLRSRSMVRGVLDDNVAHSPQIVYMLDRGPTGQVISYGFTGISPRGHVVHYVIATDKRFLDSAMAGFMRELTLWLAGLAVALVGTGLAIIAFGLRPLGRLAQAVTALREGRADRLDGRFPSEIAPLVEDLNAYVADNAAIIARARVQAGNLAHGLRTPLAVITDEAERLAMAPATRSSGEALLAQATAMARQIEFQLARARQAGAARHGGQGSLLPDLLAPLLSAMRKLHPDRRFEIVAVPDAPVRLPFDPVDLSELLSILLDNAGKWAREAVSIAIKEGAGGPCVTIADDGPGMTAEQIGLACQIGSRFDPAMPGSGLGLAIAQDIAAGYGWALRLEARAGGGLAARLMPRQGAE